MLTYHNDNTIKINHSPQINKFAFQVNDVGAHSYISIEENDEITFDDDNTIFVSDTIGDDGDAGTEAAPKKTIAAAITATTVTKIYVVVLDSALYDEDLSGCTYTYFSGIYADTGETPQLSLRTLDYVPADANTIFVAKTGADANAGTQAAPKLTLTGATGAIATCDAAHQNVVIMDSGEYTEDSFEFTGNFQGLHAALGQKPTLKFTPTHAASDYGDIQEAVAATIFEDGDANYNSVAKLQNGNFVCCYRDVATTDGKFVIYTEAGVQVVAPTEFEAGSSTYCSVAVLNNGNWVCCYSDADDGGKGKFVIYTEAGVNVAGPTQFEAGSSAYYSVKTLPNGDWICCYRDVGDTDGKFVIYTEAGVNVAGPTQFEADDVTYCSITVLDNNNFVCCFHNDTDSEGQFVIWYPYTWYAMKISVASDLNGIILDAENQGGMDKIAFINSAKLTAKWNDFKNCDNPGLSTILGYAVYGDTESDFYNNRFFDNDAGIYLTANKALIHDNQFYRNQASGGYAIHIDGAAAAGGDITIEHNDITQNNAGIRLENNTGGDSEVVKNNIIHDNDNYGINADTDVNYSYTVITDSTNNATAGTSVVLFNPLYIHEGADDPENIDLNIKVRVLGYFTDSPAKLLADDTRNAGSYNVQYIGSETSWTEITVAKPLFMEPYLEAAGGSVHVKRDGSLSSGKIGQSEYIEMKWEAVSDADRTSLRGLWVSDETECRIYPDPDENPDSYNIYFLVRNKKFPLGPKYWMQSDLGAEDILLLFGRKYEEA